MVTSKKPSPSESSPEENDAAAQPAADTAPFAESTALADTQPFAYVPHPEATQPLGVTEPRSPAENSGASGMTAPSFVKRHPLALGITAAALAVVAVSGLTAWGVATVASSYGTEASAAVAPAAPAPVDGARTGLPAARTMVRGTIHGIDGSTWTITTRAGATQRVTVDSATVYGTKKVPASVSDFAVGTVVLIVEKSAGEGRTAVRVVEAKAGGSVPSAPATPST
ncbi:hypothetical protein BH10ACT4_BH10ACT4_13430 [soil metagenome]